MQIASCDDPATGKEKLQVSNQNIERLKAIFITRLQTLDHLLTVAEGHFGAGNQSFLQLRIAPDMFPFGTQVAYVCNQPRNFALWCNGLPVADLDKQVDSVQQAREHIAATIALVTALSVDDSLLAAPKHLALGPSLQADLDGAAYVHEFVVPNLYFHLATAYNILRMHGVPVGKRDFMTHLLPFVRQAA